MMPDNIVVEKLLNSNYSIHYEENKPYTCRLYHVDKDITDTVDKELIFDVLETIRYHKSKGEFLFRKI